MKGVRKRTRKRMKMLRYLHDPTYEFTKMQLLIRAAVSGSAGTVINVITLATI